MTTPTPDKLEIPEAAVEAAAEQIMRHAAVGELVWNVCTDERQDIFRDAARAALAVGLPHMPDRGYAEGIEAAAKVADREAIRASQDGHGDIACYAVRNVAYGIRSLQSQRKG